MPALGVDAALRESGELRDAKMRAGFVRFVIALAIFGTGNGELRVRPSGTTFIRSLGSSIVFTCEFVSNNNGDGTITEFPVWLEKGRPITDRPNRRYIDGDPESNVKRLFIVSIEEEDSGDYTCTRGREAITVQLQIFKEISVDDAPSFQRMELGKVGLIRCSVSGTPAPTMLWKKGSRRIAASDPRFSVGGGGLRIANVTLRDSGEYTCRAEVEEVGMYYEITMEVIVDYPPQVVEGIGEIEVLEGSPVVLSCRAIGSPPPVVKFSKATSNGGAWNIISPTANIIDGGEAKISFQNVSQSDEGNYTCVAANDLGSHSQTGSLRVLVPPRAVVPDVVSTVVGSNVTISCLGHGDPAPLMTFARRAFLREEQASAAVDAFPDSSGNRTEVRQTTGGSLDLTISSATVGDSGIYTCTARSRIGESSSNATLVVRYGPTFAPGMVPVVRGWPGATLNMTCVVHGLPKVEVKWFKDLYLITNNSNNNREFLVFDEGSEGSTLQVTIGTEDDFGVYTCIGTNSVGSAEFNFTIEET